MSAHLPLASNFGDLPDPLRPLTMMRKAAHINLPLEKPPAIPFPDAATLDIERELRLVEERRIDHERIRDSEVPAHRENVETRTEMAMRTAHMDGHQRGFDAGFWKGARFGGGIGALVGGSLGWVLGVVLVQIGRFW